MITFNQLLIGNDEEIQQAELQIRVDQNVAANRSVECKWQNATERTDTPHDIQQDFLSASRSSARSGKCERKQTVAGENRQLRQDSEFLQRVNRVDFVRVQLQRLQPRQAAPEVLVGQLDDAVVRQIELAQPRAAMQAIQAVQHVR